MKESPSGSSKLCREVPNTSAAASDAGCNTTATCASCCSGNQHRKAPPRAKQNRKKLTIRPWQPTWKSHPCEKSTCFRNKTPKSETKPLKNQTIRPWQPTWKSAPARKTRASQQNTKKLNETLKRANNSPLATSMEKCPCVKSTIFQNKTTTCEKKT
jgi:hypothetical protein